MLVRRLHINYESVRLGKLKLHSEIREDQMNELTRELQTVGFEILDNKNSRITEQIKNQIRDLVYRKDNNIKTNLSDYLSVKMNMDYPYLASLFSETEGTTIEKYFIANKIERVKELLTYDHLSLSEIVYMLNNSSVAHISTPSKKVTAITTSSYKKMIEITRISNEDN